LPSSLKRRCEESTKEEIKRYETLGLKAIKDGEVAVLLLAGGQGTRLDANSPKGTYSVKLPSNKSLFQLQAERLIRVQELAGQDASSKSSIHWYIMTSDNTREATESYFEKNHYFTIPKERVHFFEQGTAPCFSKDGKVLLDAKSKISRSPDGNGGVYKALKKSGVLDDLNRRKVKYIHVYSVDNILVKVADPVFLGYCIEKKADCAAEVVKKTDPEEQLGVICKSNDKIKVVEYSEISEEDRNQRDEKKDLVYNAGNICNHFFTLNFLTEACNIHEPKLEYHIAEKKINHIDDNGVLKKPVTVNGVKLEKYIFDIFQFAKNFVVWEVSRTEEFSPLKNGPNETADNELSCRRDILEQHYKWLINASIHVIKPESDDEKDNYVEISPLVSYNGEGLEELKLTKLKTPVVIERKSESSDLKQITFNGLDLLSYRVKNDLI
jgi:UDP-N-acetylglucosamine/UDP-N-acetylgalactosamine diphosphorylase